MDLYNDDKESEYVLLLNPRVVKRSIRLTDLSKCKNNFVCYFMENMK